MGLAGGQRRDSVSRADSVRLSRTVRSAQASFELFRRTRLQIGYSRSGPCDATIGRYCYWRGDDDDKPPPPEPVAIRQRRLELISLLDSAARAVRGDGWIAGQRVRYLVEAGETSRARAAAEHDCRAAASWCAALAGYAAHIGGQYDAADSLYEHALAAMDEAERCRWMDISPLVDGDLAKRYDELDCAAREQLALRLFSVGAPLYMVATTDLLTEHLARRTRAQIAERAATANGEAWADDARELAIRYGFATWYTRSEPQFGSQQRPSITEHDAGRPYYFFLSLAAVMHPSAVREADWRLDEPRAPTGYAPTYARSIHDVPHQIARFRHGDSLYVVAGWEASGDTSLAHRELDVSLVLTNDVAVQAFARARGRDAGGLSTSIVADSGLISLELLDSASRHAGRARVGFALRPDAGVSLSDLLLVRGFGLGPDVKLGGQLIDRVLPSDVVHRRDSLAVFWEAYGIRHEPTQFTLAVEQIGVSWLRRAVENLHLADRTTGVRVQWEEVPDVEHGYASRLVRVDLSRLRAGRYRMQLTAIARGEAPATSAREIEVR